MPQSIISRNKQFFQRLTKSVICIVAVCVFTNLQANPNQPNVVVGAAGFEGLGTSSLTINQTSNTAIINWQNFSVGVGDTTRFVQPGVNSLAINRVVSGNPTSIYGQLSANGSVLVINPNGILVGTGGLIDVRGSLTLTTLNASNEDLLNGGQTRFFGSGATGIVNRGTLLSRDTALLGGSVSNSGIINSDRSVVIGAGNDIMLGQTANGATISVRGGSGEVENLGGITAGNVAIEAHNNTYAMAINNSGTVRATGVERQGGRVILRATGGSGIVNTGNIYARQTDGRGGDVIASSTGTVDFASGVVNAAGEPGQVGGSVDVEAANISVGQDTQINVDGVDGGSISLDATDALSVSGTITANGAGGAGGQIDLTGNTVEVDSALIDVSGFTGGRIRTGGGFQGNDDDIRNSVDTTIGEDALFLADGSRGNAGSVIIWSDVDTMFAGEVSAQAFGTVGNGGFVEVSGADTLSFLGNVSTASLNGAGGTLLLDPTNVTITNDDTSPNAINDADLVAALSANNVVIHTGGTGSQAGNVVFEPGTSVVWNGGSLTVLANNDITVLGVITNGDGITIGAGTANVNLLAGWDGTGLPGGDPIDVFDQDNTGIFDLAGLQALGRVEGRGVISINQLDNTNQVQVGSEDGQTNIIGGEIRVIASSGGDAATIGYVDFGIPNGLITVLSDGDIVIQANGVGGRARIGHEEEQATFLGNDLTVTAGISGIGSITLTGGPGQDSFAQIGHNSAIGFTGDGEIVGNIDVTAATGITLIGGSGFDTPAQIGSTFVTEDGPITGDINVDAGTFLSIQGGSGSVSYAAVGHGGVNVDGTKHGNIVVDAPTGISLTGGSALDSFASIGMFGGNTTNTQQTDITINTGDLSLVGGSGSYAAIGFVGLSGTEVDIDGDILVNIGTGGAVNLQGGPSEDLNFAQIGHSGVAANGNFDGNITVNAPSFNLVGGGGAQNYAQIGHGGGDLTGNLTGNVTVTGISDISLVGGASGDESYAQIGHGGSNIVGDITGNVVVAGSFYNLTGGGGDGNFAQIGHGGESLTGNIDGIVFTTASLFNLQGGTAGTSNFAQVGHGALSTTGDVNGNITVVVGAGGNSLVGGSGGSDNYAQIGHGGESIVGDVTGNISYSSSSGIDLTGGAGGSDNYSQIGHGGQTVSGSLTGSISASSSGESVSLTGGAGTESHAQIGHGGQSSAGGLFGNIAVSSARNVDLGGGGVNSYAQVGHGGRSSDVDAEGIINVVAGADLTLTGNSDGAHATIGHGGINSDGTKHGNIIARAAGDVLLNGGAGANSHALIGVNAVSGTGAGTVNTEDVDVTVSAGNNIEVVAGAAGFAQIGHASLNTLNSVLNGDTRVTANGDIAITGGGGFENFAKIGHGDRDAASSANGAQWNGDILVRAGDDLTVNNGLIGHVDGRIALHTVNVLNTSGNTIIEASANTPDEFGAGFLGLSQGALITDANSTFSASNELRIGVPNRNDNLIATGTLLNDVLYENPGSDLVTLELGNALGDENLNFLGATRFLPLEFGELEPVYTANARNGGNYQIYYNFIDSLFAGELAQDIAEDQVAFERYYDSRNYFRIFTIDDIGLFDFGDVNTVQEEEDPDARFRRAMRRNGRILIVYPQTADLGL